MPEVYVVVALAFAVFAAVSAIGSAIVLGIGYERLRAGLERVKEGLDLVGRQTGFFSNELHKLDQRVDELSQAKPKKGRQIQRKSKENQTYGSYAGSRPSGRRIYLCANGFKAE